MKSLKNIYLKHEKLSFFQQSPYKIDLFKLLFLIINKVTEPFLSFYFYLLTCKTSQFFLKNQENLE